MAIRTNDAVQTVTDYCRVLHDKSDDFDPLLDAIGDRRLIGEASHGTHEFYEIRAQITRQLIAECGFTAVIVEADWPDAYRVNRYVRGANQDADAKAALSGFERFPQWMWRNREVQEFVQWLRLHNSAIVPEQPRCGFYGMDLYSLYTSIASVLDFLDKANPAAARRARYRYGCLGHYGEDPQHYGYAASFDLEKSCEQQAIAQLVELQQRRDELVRKGDGVAPEDEFFFVEQNARLIVNAEEYYRNMFAGPVDTWNTRDTHMVDTIAALLDHLERTRKQRTKAVIWAHNSHLGDARATQMACKAK